MRLTWDIWCRSYMHAVSDSSTTLLQTLRRGLHGGISCIWRRPICAEGIQLMDVDASQPSDGDECSLRKPQPHKLPAGMSGTYVIPVTGALVYQLIPHVNDRIGCRCYSRRMVEQNNCRCIYARHDVSDSSEVLSI
jgi:hypothetical protein